jgi:hypothetical protein
MIKVWPIETEGYHRMGRVVFQAKELQSNLLKRGYYAKDATHEAKLVKTAIWIQASLQSLASYGTWCPEGVINIEG